MSPLVLDPPVQFDVDLDGTDSGPLLGGAPPEQPLDEPPATPALGKRPTVSLGVIAHEVAPEAVDDQAVAQELRAQANTYRFTVLDIRATIRPRENATIELLNLGVTLELNDFAMEPPIAWSLSPQRLVTTRKSPVKVNGSIEVKFLAGVKLGISYEPGDEESWWLLGTGELQSNPEWLLRRRAKIDLSGDHPLLMVVRRPIGASCRALLSLTSTTRTSGFLLHRTAALPAQVRAVTMLA